MGSIFAARSEGANAAARLTAIINSAAAPKERGIFGAHLKQQAPQRSGHKGRRYKSDGHAAESPAQRVQQDQPDDLSGRCANGHAHSHFPRPLEHQEGNQPIQTAGGQHHAYQREEAEQHSGKTGPLGDGMHSLLHC